MMGTKKNRDMRRQTMWLMILLAMLLFVAKIIYPQMTKNPTKTDLGQSKIEMLENLDGLEAGDVLVKEQIDWKQLDKYFVVNEISQEQQNSMMGKSYVEGTAIDFDQLRYIRLLHYNYDHQIQVGELVVNASIATDCVDIFMELFAHEYEIASMYLVDRYYFEPEGSAKEGAASELDLMTSEENQENKRREEADYNSINNNNSSAFNYRLVADTKVLSAHGMGMAIDINPIENPCVVEQVDGSYTNKYLNMDDYVDRTQTKEHMISHDDLCYQVFLAHGFVWGGDWEGTKDYQHFEKTSK